MIIHVDFEIWIINLLMAPTQNVTQGIIMNLSRAKDLFLSLVSSDFNSQTKKKLNQKIQKGINNERN